MAKLNGYRVRAGSPCIDAGVPIRDNGGLDLLTKEVSSDNTDLGAFESVDE